MSDKKKSTLLTAAQQRKVLPRYKVSAMVKEASEKTGFLQKDVREVWETMVDTIADKIEGIGTIYPLIQKPRHVHLFNSKKEASAMMLPYKWVLKFRPNITMRKIFSEKLPSKKQIDDMSFNS